MYTNPINSLNKWTIIVIKYYYASNIFRWWCYIIKIIYFFKFVSSSINFLYILFSAPANAGSWSTFLATPSEAAALANALSGAMKKLMRLRSIFPQR